MRAAVLRDPDKPMELEDVDVAAPIGEEVLVRNVAAGLCHSDHSFMTGAWPFPIPLPTILGHEVAGVVEAVGPLVTTVVVGDHVLGTSTAPCGRCRYCVSGRPTICSNRSPDRAADQPPRLTCAGEHIHQFAQLSGFAEQMLVHQNAVVTMPKELPLHLAAVIGCSVATGLGAVFNTARVASGDSVVVAGCGGVGLNAIQGARIVGADPIIAVDLAASQLDLALQLGAHHVIDAGKDDPVAAVRDLTEGGADHVIEASGVPGVIQQGFEMLGAGATMVCIGAPPAGTRASFDVTAMVPYERAIRGSRYGSLRPQIDLPRYAKMYLRGLLDLETLASRRVGLHQIDEGFEAMKSPGVARVVVDF
jgi:S-(hydroxymethyl)glutathione dehydrogenase / alcohol dehydrogenase